MNWTKEYLRISSLKQFPNAHFLFTGVAAFSPESNFFVHHQVTFPSAGILTKQSVEDVVVRNSWRKTACQFKLFCFIKLGEFFYF